MEAVIEELVVPGTTGGTSVTVLSSVLTDLRLEMMMVTLVLGVISVEYVDAAHASLLVNIMNIMMVLSTKIHYHSFLVDFVKTPIGILKMVELIFCFVIQNILSNYGQE